MEIDSNATLTASSELQMGTAPVLRALCALPCHVSINIKYTQLNSFTAFNLHDVEEKKQ